MGGKLGEIGSEAVLAGLVSKQYRRSCVSYDNGITPGSSFSNFGVVNLVRFNWPYKSKGIRLYGKVLGKDQLIGPTTGWTPQFSDNTSNAGKAGVDLTRWVPYVNDLLASINKHKKTCAAFGRYPAPAWRVMKITSVDPCFTAGTWPMCRTDLDAPLNQTDIFPVLEESEIVKVWCREIEDKNGIETEWFDYNSETKKFIPIPEPTWIPYSGATPEPIPRDCYKSCDFKFEDVIEADAKSPCDDSEFDVCDFLEDGTQINLKVLISDCNGARIRQVYDLDRYLNAENPLNPETDQYEVQGEIKNCDGTAFVEPPIAPIECANPIPLGNLWKLQNPEDEGVQLEYWQPAVHGGTAVPHDNVINIFGPNLDSHPNKPSHSVKLDSPSFTTTNPSVLGINDRSLTSGTDQIKMTMYACSPGPFELSDRNANTGERSAVLVDGKLYEDNTDSDGGDRSAFAPISVGSGVSEVVIATSDLSAWQGIAPTGGAGVVFYCKPPWWKCIKVFKCPDTGLILDCDNNVVEVTEKDSWCDPYGSAASAVKQAFGCN